MLNNFLAAGAVFAVISSEALAQCPDCEDLTCNWFACGCMRSVGAGCTTTIATEVVLQGILGQPQPVAGPLTVSCCSSTIPCGPNTLTYTQSTGYTFCVTVSGGWGGGLLPGWTFGVGGQWCYNNTGSATVTHQFMTPACSKKTVTILKRDRAITINTIVTQRASYSVTDTCATPPYTMALTQECGRQTFVTSATTPEYEVIEQRSACPVGSPCTPRRIVVQTIPMIAE